MAKAREQFDTDSIIDEHTIEVLSPFAEVVEEQVGQRCEFSAEMHKPEDRIYLKMKVGKFEIATRIEPIPPKAGRLAVLLDAVEVLKDQMIQELARKGAKSVSI